LLLLSPLVWLQLIKGLEQCLHQLVFCSQELLQLWVVGVGVLGLAIAVVVPCVQHLESFRRRDI
jgi:hypothetical protein